MDFLGVDHVEFYVGDARQAAFVLCSAFGFRLYGQGGPETGLPGQRSLLLGQGDCRVLLTSGLQPDHPAVDYVARHGDGVAVIAFGTPDAAAAYQGAVAGGATAIEAPQTFERDGASVVTATVSGFGDVVHRLVQREGSDQEFLPGAIEMLELPPPTGPELLLTIDHAAVCVPDGQLETTVDYYRKAFGFHLIFEEYIEVGKQGMFSQVVQSQGGGVTLTLIQPDLSRSPGQIDDFLAWHDGPGVQHLALSSRDIIAAVDALGERGVGFASTPDSYYTALDQRLGPVDLPVDRLRPRGILVDRDHWGQMYQIFAKSLHVRRTFFWELIERHGARTFGTSNIPALYEAKERELATVRQTVQAALPVQAAHSTEAAR
ncbi:4-hydroxyphenylpyruvate dioxygenase [Streptacidiphilus sp. N1-12]|uniref:4-hydroxyphenylpyruvate dioxygenase n=2 Tax=Streptacidiphilus alkalitolerans TaxID=3342712 RepID=A0ABV6WMZ9_9ACTN